MPLDLTTEHLEALAPFFKGKEGIFGSCDRTKAQDLRSLTNDHFQSIGSPEHICRPTMEMALEMLRESPSEIIETGAAAWGTKSTLLFDSYVNSFGGHLMSVDIRVEPLYTLTRICSQATKIFCDDSLAFLRSIDRTRKYDLFYLDSFDVNLYDPVPSMVHGLHEFLIILPILKKYGGLLLIDDTPESCDVWGEVVNSEVLDRIKDFKRIYNIVPGKGALVKQLVDNQGIGTTLAHEYQLLVLFNPD